MCKVPVYTPKYYRTGVGRSKKTVFINSQDEYPEEFKDNNRAAREEYEQDLRELNEFKLENEKREARKAARRERKRKRLLRLQGGAEGND